jgi:hypothetical protein
MSVFLDSNNLHTYIPNYKIFQRKHFLDELNFCKCITFHWLISFCRFAFLPDGLHLRSTNASTWLSVLPRPGDAARTAGERFQFEHHHSAARLPPQPEETPSAGEAMRREMLQLETAEDVQLSNRFARQEIPRKCDWLFSNESHRMVRSQREEGTGGDALSSRRDNDERLSSGQVGSDVAEE